jgi:hypothetical protein
MPNNSGRVRVYKWTQAGLSVKSLDLPTTCSMGNIANNKPLNSSVTVTAGGALTGGGAVALGSTATLNVAADNSTPFHRPDDAGPTARST